MGSAMEVLTSSSTHRTKQAEVEGKRRMQSSGNIKEAASMSLARFSQNLANKRKLDAAGAEFNAAGQNIQQALDQAVTGTFSQRLQAAGELGAASVQAAAAGVGGGSVEAYNRTLALNYAIQEESNSAGTARSLSNAQDQQGNIIKNAVQSLGTDMYQGNFDYSVHLDHVKQKNVIGAAILVGVASYFGGPQAGMAASDAVAASNRAANGDTEGANRYMNSAFSNGMAAASNYNSTSGGNSGPQLNSSPQYSQAPKQNVGFWNNSGQSSQGSFTIK